MMRLDWRQTMKWRRLFRPQLEQLEGRIVANAAFKMPARFGLLGSPLSSALATPLQQHEQQSPTFRGVIRGTWSASQLNPDVGITQTLSGLGTVAPLGAVQASGSLHTPGFIIQGFTTGTMVLTNAQGSVTLSLIGHQPQPGFSPPTSALDYTITGGTGAYAGASGSGVVALTETVRLHTSAGQFTMTFKGTLSLPPPHATTGIQGVAMEGPISPVSLPGVPNERPLAGAIITIQPANGGPEIARVIADQQGNFEIDLAPGTYLLVPLSPSGGRWPRGISEVVVVKADGLTDVAADYDTGIR
jgi:hypothetical protein